MKDMDIVEAERRAFDGARAAQEYIIQAAAHINGNARGFEGVVAGKAAIDILKKTWKKAVEIEQELAAIKLLAAGVHGLGLKTVERVEGVYQDIPNSLDDGLFSKEVSKYFTCAAGKIPYGAFVASCSIENEIQPAPSGSAVKDAMEPLGFSPGEEVSMENALKRTRRITK